MVMIHGFMGSGRNMVGLAQRWIARDPSLRILHPDLTGHGRSPPLPPGADLSTLARDILDTAEAEGIGGPLRIVGHSLGGRVGLAARLLEPDRVGEVVLLDIAPGPVRTEAVGTREVLEIYAQAPSRAATREEMRAYFHSRGLSPFSTEWLLTNLVLEQGEYRWRVDRLALRDLHGRVNPVDLWEAVEGGGATSCIRGGRSSFVTEEDVRSMSAAGCEVATVEEGDHYLHVHRGEEVADLLVKEIGLP